ncbi:MAG: hypothetical protein ACLRWQ_11960 [Flavonifractor plautii]
MCALSGDEDEWGAADLLAGGGGGRSRGGPAHDRQLAELLDRLTELRCCGGRRGGDAAGSAGGASTSHPVELDELESRLDVIYRLKKKYGATVEEMLDYLERSRQELDQIQYARRHHRPAEKKLEQGQGGGRRARRGAVPGRADEAAEALEARIQEELRQLDMPKVRFQVEFAPRQEAGAGRDRHGRGAVPHVRQRGRGI